MALQSSGLPIALTDIETEFGGTAPTSIDEYYKGGLYVPNTAANASIPTSGEIEMADFYGASNAVDSTPDSFTFTDVTGASLSTTYTSNQITVSGLGSGVSATVSVSGGTYSKNSASYTSSSTTAVNGDTFRLRNTSSGSYSTTTSTTLTIGGVSDSYSITTQAAPALDDTPDGWSYSSLTGQPTSTWIISASETLSGMNTSGTLSVSGGEASVNFGGFTSSNQTVYNGDGVRLRVFSSSSNSTSATVYASIGSASTSFTVTTAAAVGPSVSLSGNMSAYAQDLNWDEVTNSSNTLYASSNTVSANVSGGSGPYQYRWNLVSMNSPSGVSIGAASWSNQFGSSTSATVGAYPTTKFYDLSTGKWYNDKTYSGTIRCTVTDSNGNSGVGDASASFRFNWRAP